MRRLLLVLLLISFYLPAKSTHIRAGEITYEVIDCTNLTYRIYITGYVDLINGQVLFGAGTLDFGDGSEPIIVIRGHPRVTILFDEVMLDDKGQVGITRFYIDHTFGSDGTFIISYTEANRNAGILNMTNSINSPFYIESLLTIDSNIDCNNSPILLNPPIDSGCSGIAFYHNAGAYDKDGDSLSFEFVLPRMAANSPVDNYREVAHPDFLGVQEESGDLAYITLDSITGDMVWDAAGIIGEYNLAFVIKEWRKVDCAYQLIGYVVRDMQINIYDCLNKRPNIVIPQDMCVEAGTKIEEIIYVSDPDGDSVKIEVFSGVLELPSNPATYQPFPVVYQAIPAELGFEWQTDCSHIRSQPYSVTFKVTDKPFNDVALTIYETMNITIVAPAATGVVAAVNTNRIIDLSWDSYSCTNAESIQILRRVDTFKFIADECETGMPSGTGYELIAKVAANQTSYRDDNLGDFLSFVANYCYRIVAEFPQLQCSESYVSDETCVIIEADGAAITHATVDITDNELGQVTVSWRSPFDIDPAFLPPPYNYELWRGYGFSGEVDTKVMAISSDTTFQDTSLNTLDSVYHYVVKLFDNAGNELIQSTSASTVRLEASSNLEAIQLSWSADVPWSNKIQNFPMHLIYRDNVDETAPSNLMLIDSVNVLENNFRYTDDGRFNGVAMDNSILYSYYVMTKGSYGNPRVISPQENLSQVLTTHLLDTIPPCPPILVLDTPDCVEYLADKPCEDNQFYNSLYWTEIEFPECKSSIKGYNLYFSTTGIEDSYQLLEFVTSQQYVHQNLNSLAGCYFVKAVNSSNVEGESSEIICNDNCPNYILPNVFTPNNDGLNDTFRPMDEKSEGGLTQCPRFINSIEISFFNRWGVVVHSYKSGQENGIYINWDGKDNNGKQLESGVYYYSAKLNYNVRNVDDQEGIISGWVNIMY
jgi:gliding motility-associated-like protein